MYNIISAILTYTFLLIIFGIITYLIIRNKLYKESFYFLIGLIIFWSFLVFNITYTGLMGWNALPGSDLEALLDTITFIGEFIGGSLVWIGFTKVGNENANR